MLIPAPPLFPRKRKPRPKARRSAPPAALTLVSASYVSSPPELTLTFDRAIDIAALHGEAITVDDAVEEGLIFTGAGGAELLGPAVVKITLLNLDSSTGSEILLTATAGNGIVAVDDGGTWAGVTDLQLPFP